MNEIEEDVFEYTKTHLDINDLSDHELYKQHVHHQHSSFGLGGGPEYDGSEGDDEEKIPGIHGIPVIVEDMGDINDEKQSLQKEKSYSSCLPIENNKVGWDGPNDPENPRNFKNSVKVIQIATISLISFFVPLGSSMFAPLITQVLHEFNSDDEKLGAFCVSVFVLAFGFGPLVYGPCSELYGRAISLHVGNVLFVVTTLCCGFVHSVGGLIGVRFVAGLCGSGVFAIGGGIISDLFEPHSRSRAVAAYTIGPLIAPAVGPIVGGFVGENHKLGFRWIFYILAMGHAAVTVISLFSLVETNPVILLERKTKRLRKETGNPNLTSVLSLDVSARELFKRSFSRPFKVMYQSWLIDVLSLLNGIAYSLLFVMITTFPIVFSEQYGFKPSSVGLAYIGIGVGSMIPVIVIYLYGDRFYLYLCKRQKKQRAENRLLICVIFFFALPTGLLWYGWSSEAKAHWIIPIIGTGYLVWGIVANWLSVQAYLIDAFGMYAASATAANTFIRSVLASLIPLAGPPLYASIGIGWGNTVLALIASINVPALILIYKYGDKVRERWPINL